MWFCGKEINEAVVRKRYSIKAAVKLRKFDGENRLVDLTFLFPAKNEAGGNSSAPQSWRRIGPEGRGGSDDPTDSGADWNALEAGPDFLGRPFRMRVAGFRELVGQVLVVSNDRVQVRRQERDNALQKEPSPEGASEAVRRQPSGLVERQGHWAF